ncbi:ATP-binding protein [Kitasatospora sp. NBC_00240]|uniref:ATP-binding protein n=1 Tax=Kitasatospora sp. NBC_00240 TaxID=2903567 RepID=UPI00224FBAFB|nr:ATP-binding protein [Kitasatospora sp. NBC_00240]MCX5208841.1 ATP-binding protein [Kitasatospora sp. NBC_00240]
MGPIPGATTTVDDLPQGRGRAPAGAPPVVRALPHHPGSVRAARRITRTVLLEWGVDEDTTDQALLVVSELVTNAVEHALPPVALHVERRTGDTLHIEVDDGGPASVQGSWCAGRAPEEGGRGGGIIDVLTSAHGSRPLASGTSHWADLTTV